MKDISSVLDNYDQLDCEIITLEEVNEIINKWRVKCQSTPTPVESVEDQIKNTRLRLVKQ